METVAGVYYLSSGNYSVERKNHNVDVQGVVTPDRWGIARRGIGAV